MAMSTGFTNEEVREYVFEYERQPWGTRTKWLQEQGISRHRIARWRNAIFDGDLDRGLVPREVKHMTSSNQRRRLAKYLNHQHDIEEHERLRARIRELESTNEALGKAIGLLHQINEQEPDTPETLRPNNSSLPKTDS